MTSKIIEDNFGFSEAKTLNLNQEKKLSLFDESETEDLTPEAFQAFEIVNDDENDDEDAEQCEALLETQNKPKLRINTPVVIDQNRIDQQKTGFTIENSYAIASFDIGIKNLAFCILSYHPQLSKGSQFKLYDWQVIDLLSEDTKKTGCSRCHLNGNYYQQLGTVPREELICPKDKLSDESLVGLRPTGLSKDKPVGDPVFYCMRHAKSIDPGIKAGLEPTVLKKHRRVDNTDNLEINIEVIRALDKFPLLLQCREVIMEQQPHKNARMKNLSFMIFSYFACRGRVDTVNPILRSIKFISSKHKLNVYDGPDIKCNLKANYGRNKFYGKAYCRYMIRHDPARLELFESHKKQDDLADSYLQGAWYLKHKFDPILKKAANKAVDNTKVEAKKEIETQVENKQNIEVPPEKKASDVQKKAKPRIKKII